MSKTLITIAVLLFIGAMSEFLQSDPVVYHVPGQPVTINDVLATMTTSYMLKHASAERQVLYLLFSAVPVGLAYLWAAFDRRQAHRPKVARVFGSVLFLFGAMFAGMLPAFLAISPVKEGSPGAGLLPAFGFAAAFLAASWPLCFGWRSRDSVGRGYAQG